MTTVVFTALALVLGYLVAVGLSMAATFGIAAAAPDFVTKSHRLRRRYKFTQNLMWLVCAAAGGYVAAMVAQSAHPWFAGMLLAAAMIAVLWSNSWEMRQRGLAHQAMMSIMSVAGVAAGCMLRLR
jgi:hypothetical protein